MKIANACAAQILDLTENIEEYALSGIEDISVCLVLFEH